MGVRNKAGTKKKETKNKRKRRLKENSNQSETLQRSAWVVTSHQCGVSAIVAQTSFCQASSGDLAKRRLFSQARIKREKRKEVGNGKIKRSSQTTNGRTDKGSIERAHERSDQRKNRRTSNRTKARTNGSTTERSDQRTIDRTKARSNGRADE